MPQQSWFVYLLLCSDGTYYTGITTDVARRLRQHNGELVGGARYTRNKRPVKLAYAEPVENRSLAGQREHQLRKLPARQKAALHREFINQNANSDAT